MDQSEYPFLRTALEKLVLNDSSVSVFNDSSVALGQGWRLGFLGLLHMDVFRQRLEEVCVCAYLVCVFVYVCVCSALPCAIRGGWKQFMGMMCAWVWVWGCIYVDVLFDYYRSLMPPLWSPLLVFHTKVSTRCIVSSIIS